MKKIFLLIIMLFFLLNSCSNNTPNINNLKEKKTDITDDEYINLKTKDNVDKKILLETALLLAKKHMQKKEYILANFYIQEALQIEPYNEELKLMLIKNQYLAALNNKNSQDYLERAYKALNENINLLSSYNNIKKAKEMLNEVKELLIKSYKETSNFYKRAGKKEAALKYIEKINDINATML